LSQIVIFGVTGYAGGNIARELVRRGHSITGVARTADLTLDGVEVVTGSIADVELLRSTAAGADHLVVAIPASPRQEGDAALLDTVPDLIRTAIDAGARLSFVGGAGSLHVADGGPRLYETPGFPQEYKAEAVAHGAVLDALRESPAELDWFYVSPGAGFGSWNAGERTEDFRLGGDVLLSDADGHSDISGADYAIAYADEIERGAHPRQRFTVSY